MMADYRRWVGSASSARSKEIHVTGIPFQLKFGLNELLLDYFSRYGQVKKVRQHEINGQVVAIITFAKCDSVVRTLHYGPIHHAQLRHHMCTLHIKPMMEPVLFYKIRNELAKNAWEMPRQNVAKRNKPKKVNKVNKVNKSSSNKTPVNLNPNNSTRLCCTNYTMGKPSEIMDKLLRRYFMAFGNILTIDRPPEHDGKVAIIAFTKADSVTKAMQRKTHRMHLNRFGAHNLLTVNVWEDKPKDAKISNENTTGEAAEGTPNNQAAMETSSEQGNTSQKSSESKDGAKAIFCMGFSQKIKGVKLSNTLSRYFAAYGEVVSISYPGKFRRALAVVKFRNSTSVDLVMKFVNRHRVPTTHGGNHCSLYVDLYGRENPMSHTSVLRHTSYTRCTSVSEQIYKLMQDMSLTDKNCEDRQSCLKRLEETLKRHFPQGSCFLFGPSTNKFGYKECFCDIFFKPGDSYLENAPSDMPLEKENQVIINGENSNNASMESSNAALTAKSDTPIKMDTTTVNKQNSVVDNTECNGKSDSDLTTKLKHVLASNGITVQDTETHQEYVPYLDNTSNIVCRVWYNNMSPVYKSNLLKFYAQCDERVTSLMMTVRMWARYHRIFAETCEQEASKFSESALNWMVIFFLQNCNPFVVQSVDKLSCADLKNEFDLETSSCYNVQSENDSSVEILLWEFFNFFSNFDYSLVMCPRSGDAKYRKDVIGDGTSASQFQNSFICIQDPLEMSWNLTSNIGCELFWDFVSKCRFAVDFNPNEFKSNKFRFWGILDLFTGVLCFKNVRLQSWEFLQPKNEKPCVKFLVRYIDGFVQRVIAEASKPRKMDPKLIYEFVTAVLLHIFNRALLFDAFLQPAPEFKRLETSLQKSQEKVKGDKPAENAEETNSGKMRRDCTFTDEPPDLLAKKLQIFHSDNTKALSEVNSYECKVNIQANVEHDTWNERWKYSLSDQLQPEEVNSKTYLGQDENISCLLMKEKTPFNRSLMCQCSFDGSEGFSIELKSDDDLLDSNLLSFLTYFIPMKMDELFHCNIVDLISYFLSKDVFVL